MTLRPSRPLMVRAASRQTLDLTSDDVGKVVVVAEDGTLELGDASGGSSAGVQVLGPFPFAHDDVGLESGKVLFTPTAGMIVLDFWVEITEAWDPEGLGDIGPFDGETQGLFAYDGNGAFDLANADSSSNGLVTGRTNQSYAQVTGAAAAGRKVPGKFATPTSPWKIVGSTTGESDGASIAATQGEGNVYFIVATPTLP